MPQPLVSVLLLHVNMCVCAFLLVFVCVYVSVYAHVCARVCVCRFVYNELYFG